MKEVQWRSTDHSSQNGQELVEFAIVLPLLLLVAFGVLDLGRIFHSAITITNAAREGARYAMTHVDDVDGIMAATIAEAQGSGIDLNTSIIDVTCPDFGGCGSGLPVRVTVQYNFTFILIGAVFPNPGLTITRSAEMMVP
jgi:Flp pilus assembly protein TadG